MKKKIELSVEEARKLYKEATPEFKQLLECNFTQEELVGDITDRVKTWEDVLSIVYKVNTPYVYPQDEDEKKINSLVRLKTVIKVLNEGWIPDWHNWNEDKYSFYLANVGYWSVRLSGWNAESFSPTGLYLKSEKLCKHLIKHFSDLIKEACL